MKHNLFKIGMAIVFISSPQVIFANNQNLHEQAMQEAEAKRLMDAELAAKKAEQNVKKNADQSKSANKQAMATQALTGALMGTMSAMEFKKCPSSGYSCALGAIYLGMSVLSFAQSKEHGKAANSAAITSAQSDGLGDISDNTSLTGTMSKKDLDFVNGAIDAQKGIEKGIFNNQTGVIRTPDGKSYKASDMGSAAKMKAAGLSSSAIQQAIKAYQENSKKAEAKVAAFSNSLDGGAGGGGGPSIAYIDEEPLEGTSSGAGLGGNGGLGSSPRDPANLAGMQKNYNGEPIGVAADSIFLMMTRRYKVKDSQEAFYNEREMPVVQRTK